MNARKVSKNLLRKQKVYLEYQEQWSYMQFVQVVTKLSKLKIHRATAWICFKDGTLSGAVKDRSNAS